MKKTVFVLALTALSAMALPAQARNVSTLQFSTGVSNGLRQSGHGSIYQLEYRSADSIGGYVQPMAGAYTTNHGDAYAYGGVYHDFSLSSGFVLSPSIAIGAYHHGNHGRILGGAAEFQEGIDFYHEDASKNRFGMSLHHLSNAHMYSRNPGTETIQLIYSTPFN